MDSENQRPADDQVVLARISGLFGVKGWVKIYSYTDPRDGVLNYKDCFLLSDGGAEATRIEEGRRHGKGVVVRLAGIEDRDQAAALVGRELAVSRKALPEPEPGSYYWADLEGLEVRHKTGKVLGTVDHLIETGANDVLVVKSGEGETLIPFVIDSVVKSVDLESGVVEVDWEWS